MAIRESVFGTRHLIKPGECGQYDRFQVVVFVFFCRIGYSDIRYSRISPWRSWRSCFLVLHLQKTESNCPASLQRRTLPKFPPRNGDSRSSPLYLIVPRLPDAVNLARGRGVSRGRFIRWFPVLGIAVTDSYAES